MSELPVYRSYKCIQERKLRMGFRPMEGAAIVAVAGVLYAIFSVYKILWAWLPVAAVVSSVMCVSLRSLYAESLYWKEYYFGRNAYSNKKWTV